MSRLSFNSNAITGRANKRSGRMRPSAASSRLTHSVPFPGHFLLGITRLAALQGGAELGVFQDPVHIRALFLKAPGPPADGVDAKLGRVDEAFVGAAVFSIISHRGTACN